MCVYNHSCESYLVCASWLPSTSYANIISQNVHPPRSNLAAIAHIIDLGVVGDMTPLIIGGIEPVLSRCHMICMNKGDSLQHIQTPNLIAMAYFPTSLLHLCLRCVLFARGVYRKSSHLMVVLESVLSLLAIEDVTELITELVLHTFVVVFPGSQTHQLICF